MKRRKTVAKEEILNILKESNEAFSQDCIQKKLRQVLIGLLYIEY